MKTLSIQEPPSRNEVGFRCHGALAMIPILSIPQ
jgi:hypothetical protein